MTQSTTSPSILGDRDTGVDWTCDVCGCEIMVKHAGDPSRMSGDSAYTCRCGTRMQREHPDPAQRGPAKGA